MPRPRAIPSRAQVWHRNDGSASFTQVALSTVVDGAFALAVADVDGDADLDIVATSTEDTSVRWFDNVGEDMFGNYEWSVYSVTGSAATAYGVELADVDGDADVDILAALSDTDSVVYFRRADIPRTGRGGARGGAAGCHVDIPWRRVEATPRPRPARTSGTTRTMAARTGPRRWR